MMKVLLSTLLIAWCVSLVCVESYRTVNLWPRKSLFSPIRVRNDLPRIMSSFKGISISPTHTHSEVNNKVVPTRASFISFPSLQISDLPNALTIARIVTVPVIISSFTLNMRKTTFWLFVMSCITDFVDGYLARKLHISSPFGAFLDPVADKLLMATTLGLLTVHFPTYWYAGPVAVIMCREIAVSALREWMAERKERSLVKVAYLGKLKTALQMVATAVLLLVNPDTPHTPVSLLSVRISQALLFTVGMGLLYLSTALTVLSGVSYFRAAWPRLTGQNVAHASHPVDNEKRTKK